MKAFRSASRMAGGFMLLDCMLAVAIFALGVISLARCMENCLRAERYRREDGLAQLALSNYLVQIETEALPLADQMSEKLKGAWAGMTMNITREPLKLENEKQQELFGLYRVTLDLSWKSGSEVAHRDLSFYFYPRQR